MSLCATWWSGSIWKAHTFRPNLARAGHILRHTSDRLIEMSFAVCKKQPMGASE
jgi:hypothetical protein